MKYLTYIFLLLLSSITVVKSQDVEHCSHIVDRTSTITTFDWQQYSFTSWLIGETEPKDLVSPFFWPDIEENIYQFNEPSLAEKDFYVEDGWEAVYNNFGTSDKKVNNPGFVLYNRYTGILRVFIYLRETTPNYNVAGIDSKFINGNSTVNKMTGLLSYIKGPISPLDDFDKNIESTTPNNWDNPHDGQWLHADIPVAYDPCTCNGTKYSVLDLYPTLTDISTINFTYGKKATETKGIVTGNQYAFPSEFKAAINKLDGAQKAGTKAYKGVGSFVDLTTKIIAGYEADPAKVKDNENLKNVIELVSDLKQSASTIGAVIAIVDFLVVSSNGAAASPSNPLFTASGDLADSDPFKGLRFFLPGTQWPTNGNTSITTGDPIYNNILGVMNVLETPTAYRHVEFPHDHDYVYPDDVDKCPDAIRQQFIFLDDIKYVVNPASDMKVDDIKVAIYFPYHVTAGAPYEIDTWFTNMTLAYKVERGGNEIHYYRSPYLPLGCLKTYVAEFFLEKKDLTYCGGMPGFPGSVPSIIFDPPILEIVAKLSTKSSVSEHKEINLVTKYKTKTVQAPSPMVLSRNRTPITKTLENISMTQDATVMAWEHIEMGANINTNGHKLTVISGGSINMGENEFNPDIELKIGYPVGCDRVVPEQTAAEVKDFCQDNSKYKPDFLKNTLTEEVLKPEKEGNFSMSVYPNPFSTSTTIEFTLVEEENVTLRLFNALGAEVETIIEQESLVAGEHQRVTRSDLPSGIYFAILQTDNGSQTIKIVKQ